MNQKIEFVSEISPVTGNRAKMPDNRESDRKDDPIESVGTILITLALIAAVFLFVCLGMLSNRSIGDFCVRATDKSYLGVGCPVLLL